jgi:hypothetical protein
MTKATWSYSRGWRLLSVIVLRPLLTLLIRNKWRGLEHIPKTGGPPVDLSVWAGKQTSTRALREATNAIMADVAALLGGLRGEEPPAVAFDPGKQLAERALVTPPARCTKRERAEASVSERETP